MKLRPDVFGRRSTSNRCWYTPSTMVAGQVLTFRAFVRLRVVSRIGALLLMLAGVFAGPAPTAAAQSEIEVQVRRFGPGDHWRAGAWVPLHVDITLVGSAAGGDPALPVWVQWEVANDDGDIAEYGRHATLNRGRTISTWLYAPLPPTADDRSLWTIRIYEYRGGERGRELTGRRISPRGGPVGPGMGMLGVVGTSPLGLNQYTRPTGPTNAPLLFSHEDTRVVTGLTPGDDLPDLWYGLSMFEALFWTQTDPATLGIERIAALREWIRRGGHFVIMLPEDGNPWGLGQIARTELEDLLPRRAPKRVADVPLAELIPVLTKSSGFRDPRAAQSDLLRTSLHVFADPSDGFDVTDEIYRPLLALPDGRVPVVQRTFGFGRITVIGMDFQSFPRFPPLRNNLMMTGLPQADAFWNRVLGWRQDSLSGPEVIAIAQENRIGRVAPTENVLVEGPQVEHFIGLTGAAQVGLLAALVLFAGYWILAGPGGFFMLRSRGAVRHAWLGFAVVAGAFTLIAWLAVVLLRPSSVEIRHLTILDGVAPPTWSGGTRPPEDPFLLRARSWMSLYGPGYGGTLIELPPADLPPVPPPVDVVMSWSPPPSGSPQTFSNVFRYPVEVRRPASRFELPSRSTASRLEAAWIGTPGQSWGGGFLRVDPDDPIRIVRDGAGNEQLAGRLISDLPGELRSVLFVWIRSQRTPPRRYARSGDQEFAWMLPRDSGMSSAIGSAWRLGAGTGIVPGTPYAVQAPRDGARFEQLLRDRYVAPMVERAAVLAPTYSEERRRDLLEMITFFRQLPPPLWLSEPEGQLGPQAVLRRGIGHDLDLSAWTTRPCLIVIGYLEQSPLPFDLSVRGGTAQESGLTMVRWVVPLEMDADAAFAAPPAVMGAEPDDFGTAGDV